VKKFFGKKKPPEVREPRRPTVKMKVPVYTDGTNQDRLSITRQVRDLPEAQKARTGEIVLSKYERLYHSIYDPVMIADMDGDIMEVNARAEYNFIWSKDDLCTMNVIDLISGADKELLKVVGESISTEKYLVIEAVCVRADETRFSAEIMINSLTTLEGDMLCFFFRDVSLRKDAEEKLAQANAKIIESERVKARLDTVSTLVHELNNPLQILTCMGETENNTELQKEVGRIIAVLEKLHSAGPLQTVTDGEGTSRYDLPPDEKKLIACDSSRFLVVDDEAMLRQMFVDSLSAAFPHVAVESGEDGKQAVDMFMQRRHAIIVMDLAMPVMTGEEAYTQIEAICAREGWKLPIFVFCTGFIPSDRVKSIVGNEEMHICIKKPFTTGDLTRAVKDRLALIPDSDS
jgi:PAS domain S-box-containing protein